MLLYVHLCNVDKIKYKTIEKDFYERFLKSIYNHRTTKTNQKYPSVNL